jgi:hypothetical protein
VPALFAILLSLFDMRSVFVAAGAAMFGFALLSSYLPRRMGISIAPIDAASSLQGSTAHHSSST